MGMIYAGRASLLFWDKTKGPNSCDQDGQQTKYHICCNRALQKITDPFKDDIKAPAKVPSGASSCNAQGLQDYAGAAEGCRAAAESVGYNFDATANGGHAVPVIHEPDEIYQRTCVVCENMIYAGRRNMKFAAQWHSGRYQVLPVALRKVCRTMLEPQRVAVRRLKASATTSTPPRQGATPRLSSTSQMRPTSVLALCVRT